MIWRHFILQFVNDKLKSQMSKFLHYLIHLLPGYLMVNKLLFKNCPCCNFLYSSILYRWKFVISSSSIWCDQSSKYTDRTLLYLLQSVLYGSVPSERKLCYCAATSETKLVELTESERNSMYICLLLLLKEVFQWSLQNARHSWLSKDIL